MRTRILVAWISALLLAGATTATVRAGDEGGRVPVAVGAADEGDRSIVSLPAWWPTWTGAATTTTTSAPAATTAPPNRGSLAPATTAAPGPSNLVAQAAVIDRAGTYAVRRDGSEVRPLLAQCVVGHQRWLGPSTVAVLITDGPIVQVGLGGDVTAWTLPSVAGPGDTTIPLHGMGSLAPDGRRTVVSFGGAAFGVAVADRVARTAEVILSGDNPQASWSPAGWILLVNHDRTAVVDPSGAILRDWAPSPFGPITMEVDFRWSPDGRRLLAADRGDLNRWVVVDPMANEIVSVPQVGSGWNALRWAGPDRLVIRDAGRDHQVPPSLHLWTVGAGAPRPALEQATWPAVTPDGATVAFTHTKDPGLVEVARVQGSGRSALLRAPGLHAMAHEWSPDGEWLLASACPLRSGSPGLPTT